MKLSKASLSTIILSAVLFSSGAVLPIIPASAASGQTFHSQPPTFVGSASGFLSGPTKTSPPSGLLKTGSLSGPLSAVSSAHSLRYCNPKPDSPACSGLDPPPPSTTVPPTVNCSSLGSSSGCESISKSPGQVRSNPLALNSVDSTPFTVEPPDQGLCAGNGLVMELLNQGELQIYGADLTARSAVISLDDLMGLTASGWSSGGDIMCQYDSANGGHWFITQFVSETTEAAGGPFVGCFVGVPNTCLEGIAVSATNDPTGAYNVYFLDPNKVNSDPGASAGTLLNDFAKTAITQDSLLLFYDEFNLGAPPAGPCPGTFGCFGFNGAQEFAFAKNALEMGLPTTSPAFNVAYENMGTAANLYPISADPPFQSADASCFTGSFAGAVCWYQVIPAQESGPSGFGDGHGGTGYMVGSLDFFGAGDNRIAAFDWSGLSGLNSAGCGRCSHISFGGAVLTGQVTYLDSGGSCPASSGPPCGLAAQKAGPVPLGDNCLALLGFTPPCPEAGIATNGDGATQATYASGEIWTAVNTLVTQTFSGHGHGSTTSSEIHVGATYWAIETGGSFNIATQGYVAASHEDIVFPSVAATDDEGAIMAFTLTGNGGPTSADNGGFFPSTAYTSLGSGSNGDRPSGGRVIHIADLGKSPYDSVGQYFGLGSAAFRPRWGDYSQAIFVPQNGQGGESESGNGGSAGIYFSTEYIQSTNCADSAFLSDPTCGGTRAPGANWGSSINFLILS